MSADIDDRTWSAAFPDRTRPDLYAKDQPSEGFRPLTDISEFLVDDLKSLTNTQLYALLGNNANALVAAQKEWIELEKIAARIKQREPGLVAIKDPQKLPRHDIFEERKEAALYGYKYEGNKRILPARFTVPDNISDQEKIDCRERQEPFAQAGLIPNDKQYRSLMSAAKSEGREKNPDNQKAYTTNFAFEERPAGTWIAKVLSTNPAPAPRTRARATALSATAPVLVSDRTTRFGGEKVPQTRSGSLAPSEVASPGKRTATPAEGVSPAPKRRKLERVDSSNGLPPKKHANQYTKRREIEMAGKLAAAQEHARANGLPIPTHYTQLDALPAPVSTANSATASPVPFKKKHPNQYTKRKEREEAERDAREAKEHLGTQQAATTGLPTAGDQSASQAIHNARMGDESERPAQQVQPDAQFARPPATPVYPSWDSRSTVEQPAKQGEFVQKFMQEWKSQHLQAQNPPPTPPTAQQGPLNHLPPIMPPHHQASTTLPPPPPMHGFPYGGYLQPQPMYHNGYRYPPYDPVYSIHNSHLPPPPLQVPVQPPPKPKQPNQYTKRREQQEADRQKAQQAAYYHNPRYSTNNQGPPYDHQYMPFYNAPPVQPQQQQASVPRTSTPTQPGRDTSAMTKEEKRKFIFKDHELRAELELDHSWLNDDPDKALAWKSKILHSNYPVRTWAMLRKWREWKTEGKDKRPRDKDGNRIRDDTPTNIAPNNIKDTQADTAAETHSEDDLVQLVARSPSSDGELVQLVARSSPLEDEVVRPVARSPSPARRPPRLRTRVFGINGPSAPSSPLVNGITTRELDTIDIPTSSFTSKLQDMAEPDSTSKVDTWQVNTETEYSRSTAAGKGVLRTRKYTPSEESEDPLHGSTTSNLRSASMRRTRSGLSNAMSAESDDYGPRKRLTRTISHDQESKDSTRRSTRGATSNPKRPMYAEPETSESEESEESPIIGRQSLRPNPPKRTLTAESEVAAARRSGRKRGSVKDDQGSFEGEDMEY